jgi:5,10-methylenetetrahydromethanopterin reductase
MLKTEIGISFNGDLPPKYIVKGSKIAEATGYRYIWIGEAAEHMHPFPIIALVSQETETIKVGTGIISPQLNHCHHIVTAFQTLQESYGNRFVVGLAPGDYRSLKITGVLTSRPSEKVKSCVAEFRKSLTSLPIYVGASGPKMLETGSKIADGVLMNYVYPDFLKWALKFFREGPCRKVAYGPALLKSDRKNLELLRVYTAVVFSGANKAFLEEFRLENAALKVGGILQKEQFGRLKDYDDILLEKFAIYGSLREVEERIEGLKALGMNQVVFATPLCRNFTSVKKIGQAFS